MYMQNSKLHLVTGLFENMLQNPNSINNHFFMKFFLTGFGNNIIETSLIFKNAIKRKQLVQFVQKKATLAICTNFLLIRNFVPQKNNFSFQHGKIT